MNVTKSTVKHTLNIYNIACIERVLMVILSAVKHTLNISNIDCIEKVVIVILSDVKHTLNISNIDCIERVVMVILSDVFFRINAVHQKIVFIILSSFITGEGGGGTKNAIMWYVDRNKC